MFAAATCALARCAGVTSTFKGAGYYDTRRLATGTVTAGAAHASSGTGFFAFSDLETESTFPKYLEARLIQRIFAGIAGLVEYNRDFNGSSGIHRFGFTYQLPLPQAFVRDRLSLKYTPFSTRDRGGQFSFSGSKRLGPDMSIDGYFDYNLKLDRIVTEWQFGRRLKGSVYGVIEARYSGLRPESAGLGIGMEWRIK